MSFLKYLTLILILFFLPACESTQKVDKTKNIEKAKIEKIKKIIIPDYITLLFVSQPNCPSCKRLLEVMDKERPKELIKNYFKIKKVNFGGPIPDNLPPVNGTPTVYILGSNDEALVEPIYGEKNETELLEYLDDALYEFNVSYGVDIRERNKEQNLTQSSENNESNQSNQTL